MFDPLQGAPMWAFVDLIAARNIVLVVGWLYGIGDIWLDQDGDIGVKVPGDAGMKVFADWCAETKYTGGSSYRRTEPKH